jgi:hypothetical protein
MRGLFALTMAVFVLGVPAGLVVWLDGPSTSDHGSASRTQYVKMISNENVPSDPPAEEPRKNVVSSEESGKRAYVVPDRRPETALSGAPKLTATVDKDHETVGSVGTKTSVNAPTTAFDDHSALDPKPRLKAKAAIDGSRPLEKNSNRPGKVLQFSRTLNDRHSRKRFSELLNNPLALRCINCLLFGY